jgi:hypothetical protein
VQHVPVSANIAGPGQRGFIVSSDLFWWADRTPMQLGNGLQNTQMHSACTGPGSAWDRQPVPGSSATLKAEYFSVGYLVAVSAKIAKKEEDGGAQVIFTTHEAKTKSILQQEKV